MDLEMDIDGRFGCCCCCCCCVPLGGSFGSEAGSYSGARTVNVWEFRPSKDGVLDAVVAAVREERVDTAEVAEWVEATDSWDARLVRLSSDARLWPRDGSAGGTGVESRLGITGGGGFLRSGRLGGSGKPAAG